MESGGTCQLSYVLISFGVGGGRGGWDGGGGRQGGAMQERPALSPPPSLAVLLILRRMCVASRRGSSLSHAYLHSADVYRSYLRTYLRRTQKAEAQNPLHFQTPPPPPHLPCVLLSILILSAHYCTTLPVSKVVSSARTMISCISAVLNACI
jgi:hypothetical protein